MNWFGRCLDPVTLTYISRSSDFYTFYIDVALSLGCVIRNVSAEGIAIRGNGTGLEYMCPTRHFVYIFFNPVFQLSTAKNEINLFNNHLLIVVAVTFAPADLCDDAFRGILVSYLPRWLSKMHVRLVIRRLRVRSQLGLATCFNGDWSWDIFYGHSLSDSKRANVSFWQKNVHKYGYTLRGLSQPKKSVK